MKKALLALVVALGSTAAIAQQLPNTLGELHGNFQFDGQYYRYDSIIGTPKTPEKFLNNGFMNLVYTRGNFYTGLRYESYLNPLNGFSANYKGSGVPFKYAGYATDDFDVTVGNFYEQFGNGLIFRSYEERNLGIDNAMEGIRMRYSPVKGIHLKGLVGRQRFYFSTGTGIVRGLDAEVNINDLFSSLANAKLKVIFGGSGVSKYQIDDNPIYKLPENVLAVSGRSTIIYDKLTLNGEYSYKAGDPSSDNNFIYKAGTGLLVSAGYATKGLGITLTAKRIENMSFRSDRNANINDLTLSFLPATSRQHTYMLAAFYPYATQPNGEIGFQGDFVYNFKKGSFLGGKYGANLSVNYSTIHNLDTSILLSDTKTGYTSNFLGWGKLYYDDINIELTKKLSSKWKATLMYMKQQYNKDVIQGLAGFGIVKSNIYLSDVSYKVSNKVTVRNELQWMQTKQDDGSWAAGLVELTFAPHYFVAVYDQYNYGNPVAAKQVHYITGQFGYLKNTLRIAMGYGRQRQGIICVGGVCRALPASNGLTLSVTSSF